MKAMKAMKVMKRKREAGVNSIIGTLQIIALNFPGKRKRQEGNGGPQGQFIETDPIAT